MKTPQNLLIPVLFFAVIAMSASDCSNSGATPASEPEPNQPVSDKWILGRVELPADETSWGLIGFSKSDVYWIPYQHTGTALELHDTVYFKIRHLQVDSAKVAYASDVTTTRPSEICSGNCIANAWINGVAFLPHKMFTHVGGRTFHRPGHVIQSATTPSETRSLQIVENGVVLQTQEFQLKVVQYQESNEEETIYIPTEWLSALSDPQKNYYMDFYDTKINDKRVLRSYSIEHSHPGHISNVTIKEQ